MTDELIADRHLRSPAPGDLAAARDLIERIIENLGKVMHAPRAALEHTAVCLVAEGHLIIEDFPGVGKTTLAKALARSVGCSFSRIQFTPDLLPSDVTGVNMFSQQTGEFEFRPGPVFANLLLIDEINRGVAQDAVRPARVHAGAPGHGRRCLVRARAAVHGDGYTESNRVRGHIPIARSRARSLRAAHIGRLSRVRR